MPHFDEWGKGGTLPNLNEVLLKSLGGHGLSNSRISVWGKKKAYSTVWNLVGLFSPSLLRFREASVLLCKSVQHNSIPCVAGQFPRTKHVSRLSTPIPTTGHARQQKPERVSLAIRQKEGPKKVPPTPLFPENRAILMTLLLLFPILLLGHFVNFFPGVKSDKKSEIWVAEEEMDLSFADRGKKIPMGSRSKPEMHILRVWFFQVKKSPRFSIWEPGNAVAISFHSRIRLLLPPLKQKRSHFCGVFSQSVFFWQRSIIIFRVRVEMKGSSFLGGANATQRFKLQLGTRFAN